MSTESNVNDVTETSTPTKAVSKAPSKSTKSKTASKSTKSKTASKSKTSTSAKKSPATSITSPRVTKSSRALEIYNEVIVANGGTRKAAIERYTAELGMSKAGASTYFQNAKKVVNAQIQQAPASAEGSAESGDGNTATA
jgi:hypothetical protein